MGDASDQHDPEFRADLERIRRVCPSFLLNAYLPATGKCSLFRGMVGNMAAIAKVLTNTEHQWVDRFRHEIRFYQLVGEMVAPVAIPRIYAADDQELVLVLDRIKGQPLAGGRYLDREIDRCSSDSLLRTVRSVNTWRPWPTPSNHDSITAMESTLAKGVTGGLITPEDASTVLRIVDGVQWEPEFSHGDLLPGNCMLAPDHSSVTLLDWEFANYRVPGYDLALLFMVSGHSRIMRKAIVDEIGANAPARQWLFLASPVTLISREVRNLEKALHITGFKERQEEMQLLLGKVMETVRLATRDSRAIAQPPANDLIAAVLE